MIHLEISTSGSISPIIDIKKENLDNNQSPVFDFPATNQISGTSPAAISSPFDPSKLATNSPIMSHNFNQSQMSWMDQFNQFQQQTQANLPAPDMKVRFKLFPKIRKILKIQKMIVICSHIRHHRSI